MRRTPRVTVSVAMVVVFAVGGLLAGCGSSSKKASSTTASTAAAAAPTTTAAPAATPSAAPLVTAKKADKLGTILADKAGLTLYTLTNNGKAVACTGPCLNAWPPLVAPAGVSTPQGAPGITGLGTAAGAGGLHLVSANGLPLYTFVKDKDGEDVYGEGLKSFGGVWHVAKTTAAPTAATKSSDDTPETSTPTTSSSGY